MKWHIAVLALVALLALMPLVAAVDYAQEPTVEDKATFDQILTPVMKIYNFVKYAASVIAVAILLFAGIKFMTNGHDPKKRDEAKHMAMYVFVGLIVIWAAPFVVQYII